MEDQFGVSIGDAAIASARTIADLRRLVTVHQPEPPGELPGKDTQEASVQEQNFAQSDPANRVPAAIAPKAQAKPSTAKYPHWPWSPPVQLLRILFIEVKLRPLVWLLAHPRVECDPKALPPQPSIYVANHVTAFDVPLVLYALPRPVRLHMSVAMSAELLQAWKQRRRAAGVGAGPLRWLAPVQAFLVTALLNVFPLPAGAGLRRSFAHAGEALDRGYNVLVFPEGRRTLTGELQPFQTGISLLAAESRTQVVPVGIAGLWQAAQRTGFSVSGRRGSRYASVSHSSRSLGNPTLPSPLASMPQSNSCRPSQVSTRRMACNLTARRFVLTSFSCKPHPPTGYDKNQFSRFFKPGYQGNHTVCPR